MLFAYFVAVPAPNDPQAKMFPLLGTGEGAGYLFVAYSFHLPVVHTHELKSMNFLISAIRACLGAREHGDYPQPECGTPMGRSAAGKPTSPYNTLSTRRAHFTTATLSSKHRLTTTTFH